MACRLEAKKNSPCSSPAAGSMEDYFPCVDSCAADGVNEDSPQQHFSRAEGEEGEENMYAQLAQKDRDLNLAAELGKALLEQNQELKAKNHNLVEQYSQQIEDLNQEKYEVKLRLDRVQDEYELTLRDLQQELTQVREELAARDDSSRKADSVKSEVMKELTQQNQRLTQQLRKACHTEESLQSQVDSLKRQLSNRRTSLQDHVHQLQVLTDEIQMLTERRSELEKRVNHLTMERDTLAANFEEAQDRILLMERQKIEQERQIRSLEQQKTELEEQNMHLTQRLDSLSIHSSQSVTDSGSSKGVSLLTELSGLDHTISNDSLDAISPENQQLRFPVAGLRPPAAVPQIFLEESDYECDDAVLESTCMSADSLDINRPFWPSRQTSRSSREGEVTVTVEEEVEGQEDEEGDLTSELLHIHGKLKDLHHQLQPQEESGLLPVPAKQLKELNTLLQETLESVSSRIKEAMPEWSAENGEDSSASFSLTQMHLEKKISSLQTELSNSRSQLQDLRTEMTSRNQQLKHREVELQELKSKLACRDGELRHLRKELDKLQDEAAGLTRDAVVDQARWERDQALKKRNKLEVELGQVKVDLMALEGQLMEAVQQKLELSQQLDLWQVDMQELIGTQVAKRMEELDGGKGEESKSRSTSPQPPRKRFHFKWN